MVRQFIHDWPTFHPAFKIFFLFWILTPMSMIVLVLETIASWLWFPFVFRFGICVLQRNVEVRNEGLLFQGQRTTKLTEHAKYRCINTNLLLFLPKSFLQRLGVPGASNSYLRGTATQSDAVLRIEGRLSLGLVLFASSMALGLVAFAFVGTFMAANRSPRAMISLPFGVVLILLFALHVWWEKKKFKIALDEVLGVLGVPSTKVE